MDLIEIPSRAQEKASVDSRALSRWHSHHGWTPRPRSHDGRLYQDLPVKLLEFQKSATNRHLSRKVRLLEGIYPTTNIFSCALPGEMAPEFSRQLRKCLTSSMREWQKFGQSKGIEKASVPWQRAKPQRFSVAGVEHESGSPALHQRCLWLDCWLGTTQWKTNILKVSESSTCSKINYQLEWLVAWQWYLCHTQVCVKRTSPNSKTVIMGLFSFFGRVMPFKVVAGGLIMKTGRPIQVNIRMLWGVVCDCYSRPIARNSCYIEPYIFAVCTTAYQQTMIFDCILRIILR